MKSLFFAAPIIALASTQAVAQQPQPVSTDTMASLRADLQHVLEDVNKLLSEANQRASEALAERDKLKAELAAKSPPKPSAVPAGKANK